MGINVHPLDRGIDAMAEVRGQMVAVMEIDGIDADEAATLAAFDEAHGGISQYRLREVAADAYVRNGIMRHVTALFADSQAVIAPRRPALDTKEVPLALT